MPRERSLARGTPRVTASLACPGGALPLARHASAEPVNRWFPDARPDVRRSARATMPRAVVASPSLARRPSARRSAPRLDVDRSGRPRGVRDLGDVERRSPLTRDARPRHALMRCQVSGTRMPTRRVRQTAALVPVELSFCVVNTEQRGLLRYCLDSIARERATLDFETEVLVLDNASQDGSVEAASRHPVTTEVIALPERQGKAANDSLLLQRAQGRFCLLLNEDSELELGLRRRPVRRAGPRRAGRSGRRDARAARRRAAALGVALPVRRHRAAVRAVAAQALRRAEHGRRRAAGGLGAVGRDARAPLSGRGHRLLRHRLLRLLRRGRLLQAPPGRRPPRALRPRRPRRPPRAAADRQRPEPADRRVLPQPRPLHAQAPLVALGLRGARASPPGRTPSGPSAPSSSPATTRSATSSTSPRRSSRAAAKGCGRAPRSSTGGWSLLWVASTSIEQAAGGAQLARPEEARRHQRQRQRGEHERPAHEAHHAVGREQQLAGRGEPADDHHEAEEATATRTPPGTACG